MKIYKIAIANGELREIKNNIDDLKKDIKDITKDIKKQNMDERIKKIEKTLEELNIGNRKFYQTQGIFTSLQRKIEKFEVVEQEWKKYKEEIDDNIKKNIEKKFRAQVK